MISSTRLQEMAVLCKPSLSRGEWVAHISEERREALEELLEEVVRLQRLVAESRGVKKVHP